MSPASLRKYHSHLTPSLPSKPVDPPEPTHKQKHKHRRSRKTSESSRVPKSAPDESKQRTEESDRWRQSTRSLGSYTSVSSSSRSESRNSSNSSHPFGVPEIQEYIQSDSGGAIPGPKVFRSQTSVRSDIPRYGVFGEDILDGDNMYYNLPKRNSPSPSGCFNRSQILTGNKLSLSSSPTSGTLSSSSRLSNYTQSSFISVPPMISAFDKIISNTLPTYLKMSALFGSLVQEQASMVEELFNTQRDFLLSSCRGVYESTGSGPGQANQITLITEFADKHNKSSCADQLFYISSTITTMGWVVISPNPVKFIKTKYEQGHQYVERIMAGVQGTEKSFIKAWVDSWLDLIGEVTFYVSEYHPQGVKWNS
ncbi:adenylyl cyclase-associated protein [Eurytemora carolleeae]|uniref:adenylyl cyclase-associated protein n=1 Tax=Eurytemora carolleeae TaxID=1294199 RepID=UPI000C757519|nr:adenylyl cyclase-associated protein [Eurytemora carolleeae]|eukprot:XP_023323821.1 adenylyl cyclase-associated protein-like [Eurytemora affinis]